MNFVALVKAAWLYRFYIDSTIRQDFRNRVARSRLGMLWIVISPLSQVAIYAFVLSALMSSRLPGVDNRFAYSIYLMAGFNCWFLFTEILMRCLTVFIDNSNALKKISFPRVVLPIIVVGTAVINNAIFFALVMIAYVLLGHAPGWEILWYPALTLLTSAGAIGLGLSLGVLNVFVRDVGQAVSILLQFAFWLTPVVYVVDIIPESYRPLLYINPMYWLVEAYHSVFVFGRSPDLIPLFCLGLVALALLGLASLLFRKSSAEMVDVL